MLKSKSNKIFLNRTDYLLATPIIRFEAIDAIDIETSDGINPFYKVVVYIRGGNKFTLKKHSSKNDAEDYIKQLMEDIEK